jgi:hypothetical protein
LPKNYSSVLDSIKKKVTESQLEELKGKLPTAEQIEKLLEDLE